MGALLSLISKETCCPISSNVPFERNGELNNENPTSESSNSNVSSAFSDPGSISSRMEIDDE